MKPGDTVVVKPGHFCAGQTFVVDRVNEERVYGKRREASQVFEFALPIETVEVVPMPEVKEP